MKLSLKEIHAGKAGRAPLLLLWLLGVPLPVIGIIFLLQGCHGG